MNSIRIGPPSKAKEKKISSIWKDPLLPHLPREEDLEVKLWEADMPVFFGKGIVVGTDGCRGKFDKWGSEGGIGNKEEGGQKRWYGKSQKVIETVLGKNQEIEGVKERVVEKGIKVGVPVTAR